MPVLVPLPLLVDFESRSRADLRKVGGRLYWEHPSTEVLCAVLYDTDSGALDVWRPGMPAPALMGAVAAHNAVGFDQFAAARAWGWPIDTPWIDTSELARRAGLPGALDALATRWLGLEKDKAASTFTKLLSTCRRPSGKGPNAIPPEVWSLLSDADKRRRGVQAALTPDVIARVVSYCVSDVEIMAHGWELLEPWLELEPDVSRVDRAINDRGIGFDVQLAKALLRCDERNAEHACEFAARKLGPEWSAARVRTVASSPAQFCAVTGALNAQAETVAALAHPLARAREALASIARGKLEAGLARVSADGRLRDMHWYMGAHTGRWSARGMQLHNMPRPAKRFEGWGDREICTLADAVLAGKHHADQTEVDLLLRATLVAKPGRTFAVCDFTGVEARALAWCAGDHEALNIIASGTDPYRVAAASIFGVGYDDIPKGDERRQVGKVSELACGYGGGPRALSKMAQNLGVDLRALGVNAQAVVDAWRDQHAPIVWFWREVEDAFREALDGNEGAADRFSFTPSDDGHDVAMFLPSGRPIVYNGVHTADGKYSRPELAFSGRFGEEHTYGGKLVENAIQGLCRDLMADALVRAEAAGLDPVLHVHDEIVAEVPANAGAEGLEYLHAIMTELPAWAEGFPIGAAGHVGRRYRK